jgi:hypothetical protein
MAWAEITRPKYQREELRYASVTIDAARVVIGPPLPAPARRDARPSAWVIGRQSVKTTEAG